MHSIPQEYFTVIASSIFSILGVVVGILLKYILDFFLEKTKLRNEKKKLVHEQQLKATVDISCALNNALKSCAFMINSIGSDMYNGYRGRFTTIMHGLDDLLVKKMLLINAEINNESLEIANNLTRIASLADGFPNNGYGLENIKKACSSEHSFAFEKKLQLDNIMRKFVGITD